MEDSSIVNHFTSQFAAEALNTLELPTDESLAQLSTINDRITAIFSRNILEGEQLIEFTTFVEKYHEKMSVISQDLKTKDLDGEVTSQFTDLLTRIKAISKSLINKSSSKTESSPKNVDGMSVRMDVQRGMSQSQQLVISEAESQIPVDVKEALKTSSRVRYHKLELLEQLDGNSEYRQAVIHFESELVKLEDLFLEFKLVGMEFDRNPEDEEIKTKAKKVEIDLVQSYQSLIEKYSLLDVDPVDFNFLTEPETSYTSMRMNFEVTLNCIVNQQLLIKQMTHFVNENKQLILEKVSTRATQQLRAIALDEVQVNVTVIPNGDGHNGGKQPVIITLSNGKTSFTCICKPRNAEIDRAVIDIFQKINQLPQGQRSSSLALPSYSIITPKAEEGWSFLDEIGEISLWEYVKGKPIDKANANVFVGQKTKFDSEAPLKKKIGIHGHDFNKNACWRSPSRELYL